MESLSVLNEEQIKGLLESLTADELEAFHVDLKTALHDYSVGSQIDGADSDIHQPHRQTINSSSTGATTLFMPSGSPAGLGVKGEQNLRVPYEGDYRPVINTVSPTRTRDHGRL